MRTTLFSMIGTGVLLLVACGSHETVPLPPNAATASTAVAATAPPAPRSMPSIDRSENPLPAADHEEPTDVSALRIPQPEDAEPEPVK